MIIAFNRIDCLPVLRESKKIEHNYTRQSFNNSNYSTIKVMRTLRRSEITETFETQKVN